MGMGMGMDGGRDGMGGMGRGPGMGMACAWAHGQVVLLDQLWRFSSFVKSAADSESVRRSHREEDTCCQRERDVLNVV